MKSALKPVVLHFAGYYLPGFKAGGILRSLVNLVEHLHGEFDCRIVTRDHDLGERQPYPGIQVGTWQRVGGAEVHYLQVGAETVGDIVRLIRATPHDLLYLHSFYDPLTIKVLLARRIGRIGVGPVVLSPHGEFAPAARRQKHLKKRLFRLLARGLGLHKQVSWHASTPLEAADIAAVLGIPVETIHIARDLPTLCPATALDLTEETRRTGPRRLRVVFLSRVSPVKNLDFALRVLGQVKVPVEFDIIGPIEDEGYWAACQDLVRALPANVRVRALGGIGPQAVVNTLAQYDVLLLPSAGENYSHVIAEALTAGTPVLISTHTPWRDLQARGLGWDLPLDNLAAFAQVLMELSSIDESARIARRRAIRGKITEILAAPPVRDEHRRMITRSLKRDTNL